MSQTVASGDDLLWPIQRWFLTKKPTEVQGTFVVDFRGLCPCETGPPSAAHLQRAAFIQPTLGIR